MPLGISNSFGIPFSKRAGGGAGFDPDYQSVLDYATTEGYTLPSAGQQVLQNQLVIDLKDAGVWSKLDSFSVYATDGDADFALVDWVRLTTQNAISSPTFTVNQGYAGDGVSAYIDTLYNPFTDAVNFLLNDNSFGGENLNATAQQGVFISAFDDAPPQIYSEISNDNPNTRFIVFDSSPIGRTPSVLADEQDGHLIIDRNNSSAFEFYRDNVSLPLQVTVSVGLPNVNFRLFARSNDSFYGNGEATYNFMGASLDATERGDLISAIDNYKAAI